MSSRRDSADGPEDIDAAFAEIVAGIERDTPMARWPEDDPAPSTEKLQSPAANPPDEQEELSDSRDWAPGTDTEDEGHYEPPEPPPLPTPGAGTLGGIGMIVVGLLLLLVPGLSGMGSTAALPLGLVAISGGIAWLLFRIRRNPPDPEDDGAQL